MHGLLHHSPQFADMSKGEYNLLIEKSPIVWFTVQKCVVLFEGVPKEGLVCQRKCILL